MPVIRAQPTGHDPLVARLAQELGNVGGGQGEPLVFENPLGNTDSFFAIVIWTEWRTVPWSERGLVIRQAYQKFDEQQPARPPRAAFLTICSGLTWEEADQNAFFPFGIEPLARVGEVDSEAVRKAMLDEGAFLTAAGPRLRFRTEVEATGAYTRLQKRLPNANWVLTRIQPAQQ